MLKDEREARRKAEAELASLKQQMQTPDTPAAQGGEPPAAAELSDQARARVELARDQYGDLFAEEVERNERLMAELATMRTVVGEIVTERHQVQQAKAQTEQEEAQAAIDGVPVLREWQRGADPNYKLASDLHALLMQNDQRYASLSWAERMAALPGRMAAAYGIELPARSPADQVRKTADAKLKATGARVPTSLSDIPGGQGATTQTDPVGDLDRMSPTQIQAQMNKLANDPSAMQKFLSAVS